MVKLKLTLERNFLMNATFLTRKGPFKCYVSNAVECGGDSFPGKKRYKGVQFNVFSVLTGWLGVKFPGEKRYVTVTLEWPPMFDQRL